MFTKKRIITATSCALLIVGINADAGFASSEQMQSLPKASADANYVIRLWSNVENTSFYVDGKPVGVAQSPETGGLEVLINGKQAHTFSAEAPGYKNPPPNYIQPDYSGISDKVKFSFIYTDDVNYQKPEPTPAYVDNRTINIPHGKYVEGDDNSVTIGRDQINQYGQSPSSNQKSQKSHSSARPEINVKENYGNIGDHNTIENQNIDRRKSFGPQSEQHLHAEVHKFAEDTCKETQHKEWSKKSRTDIELLLDANIKKLLQKLIDLHVLGNIKYSSEDYSKDLIDVVRNDRDCENNVSNKLNDILSSKI